MPPPKRQTKNPSRPGPGRPDTGIRSGYVRVEVYLPAGIRDALDRLADRREVQTGKSTRRADIIRDALMSYLRQHLPEAGL
jgi:metal-responsive CopG/Arc/MetJ family transcriptional regulator